MASSETPRLLLLSVSESSGSPKSDRSVRRPAIDGLTRILICLVKADSRRGAVCVTQFELTERAVTSAHASQPCLDDTPLRFLAGEILGPARELIYSS
eukprot:2082087-Prymnesium_polylepis.3